jgi:hypothetical protein
LLILQYLISREGYPCIPGVDEEGLAPDQLAAEGQHLQAAVAIRHVPPRPVLQLVADGDVAEDGLETRHIHLLVSRTHRNRGVVWEEGNR